jgi:signal transduction histidine kinase
MPGRASNVGRRAFGLRAQLALQVAVAVGAVVVLFLFLRGYIIQETVDRVGRQRLAVGQVLANYVDAQLADQLQQLARAAARLPQAGQAGAPAVLDDLRSRLDTSIYGVFLLDPSGQPIAADPLAAGPVGTDLAGRPEVAEALAQSRAAVSNVHAGPDGRAQVGLVVPARLSAGGEPGAVGIVVDPTNRRFAELVGASVSLGGRTGAEVIDRRGVVVTATERERVLLPGRFVDVYLRRLQAREPAVATAASQPDAERYLIAFVPLTNAPWGLALLGPEDEVLAPIRQLDPPLVALVVATLLILIALATLTARSVIVSVQTLIASARRIARGDLASAVPRGGGAELAQLAHALEEMRVSLRDAELARQEVDRLKDEFVSSVSHELRTPLGYIKGYTTTLLRRDTHWDAEVARQFLEIVDESSDQLEALVDGLLDMSRITEGVLTVTPRATGLDRLIDDVARLVNGRSSDHSIDVAVPDDLPPAMADPARIQQVLGNLIDNAVKYSPDGGRITLSAASAGGEVVVSVRDEGIGIPDEMLETAFDRFQRGRDPAVMKIRGVGLGLPICRGIVQAHGGRIWAERAPERGTIVRFSLPIAPTGPAAEGVSAAEVARA